MRVRVRVRVRVCVRVRVHVCEQNMAVSVHIIKKTQLTIYIYMCTNGWHYHKGTSPGSGT